MYSNSEKINQSFWLSEYSNSKKEKSVLGTYTLSSVRYIQKEYQSTLNQKDISCASSFIVYVKSTTIPASDRDSWGYRRNLSLFLSFLIRCIARGSSSSPGRGTPFPLGFVAVDWWGFVTVRCLGELPSILGFVAVEVRSSPSPAIA